MIDCPLIHEHVLLVHNDGVRDIVLQEYKGCRNKPTSGSMWEMWVSPILGDGGANAGSQERSGSTEPSSKHVNSYSNIENTSGSNVALPPHVPVTDGALRVNCADIHALAAYLAPPFKSGSIACGTCCMYLPKACWNCGRS